jgi:hypothetical protein
MFRLTLDKYRESPNILPRPEVFIRAIQRHSEAVAVRIAATWELSDEALAVLQQQAKHNSPDRMTLMAQSVYYSRLAAELMALVERNVCEQSTGLAVLVQQGLESNRAQAVFAVAKELQKS